jgi:hypothetical protein
MRPSPACCRSVVFLVLLLAVVVLTPGPGDSACCYFTAKNQDVLQPAQKAFITWDPAAKVETFTVQPRFEGNALDFGMVIPTPGKPKLDEVPRDFFKELAVFTVLKRREQPVSYLQPPGGFGMLGGGLGALGGGLGAQGGIIGQMGGQAGLLPARPPTVRVEETGVVGALDYKVLTAERADDLFVWLKDHHYRYAGDEATLDFYIRKKWYFTVMKIDTVQMKRRPDGTYDGEVTPTRFRFPSDRLVYPRRITQISVKDHTEALFYVQAPYKVDLPGDLTYQYQWLPMLQNARGWYAKGIFGTHELPGKADDWLRDARDHLPALLKRGDELGFSFANRQRPTPNRQGRTATTLEWAGRLTANDVAVLRGQAAYGEKVPDVDEGFTQADVADPRKAAAVFAVVRKRLEKCRAEHPAGYLVRAAPAEDVGALRCLVGHLQEGAFLTKLRKTFTRGEMDDDLLLVPARLGNAADRSEYEEVLPTSPP